MDVVNLSGGSVSKYESEEFWETYCEIKWDIVYRKETFILVCGFQVSKKQKFFPRSLVTI